MLLQMYVVRDTQAEASMPPMYRENVGVAMRDFEMAVHSADNPMSKNPDDYVLYHVGTYDDENMIVTGMDPVRIITGLEAYKGRQQKLDKIDHLRLEIEAINAGKETH